MDSADEEPELPSAVQGLIRRLEGKGERTIRLPKFSEKEFGDFFPEIASLLTITQWRCKVRLRVLEAIGSCNNFKMLDLERFVVEINRGWRKTLVLKNAWEDASAVKHVADMINSAPLLGMLRITYIDAMEEEAVGILSQALIQSSSLEEMHLVKVDWGAALLLRTFAGDDRNRSVEYFLLEEMDRIGGCLGELLQPVIEGSVVDELADES
ncbi:hypothetical protein AXG93_2253s1260 [Marchantia polymorpha subsp. ruderalis]|uniref:Uncharacterized protein n=1 Tax=Marchantia polymorpha subsp. ruderalis TaxID=1480154 RepID=A0A176VU95_MARPO|nr:hypothetical protein AXG93_2253s1260 [Marchantia polymorpha subsp. ruderalis]